MARARRTPSRGCKETDEAYTTFTRLILTKKFPLQRSWARVIVLNKIHYHTWVDQKKKHYHTWQSYCGGGDLEGALAQANFYFFYFL